MTTFTAANVEQDAYERMNRLSPGETLSADDAAYAFRRLNLLVDELAANQPFLYRDVLTSAAQTGNITLGAGAWIGIAPGEEIISASVNGLPMSPLTIQQYNEQVATPTATGSPQLYAYDGFATVYLIPVATGQTIQLQTRAGVSAFVDQTTSYTAPDGYQSALGAALAVRCAPAILGGVPDALLKAEKKCMLGIANYVPAIVDIDTYNRSHRRQGSILYGP